MFYGQADQISKGFKNSIVGEEKTFSYFQDQESTTKEKKHS